MSSNDASKNRDDLLNPTNQSPSWPRPRTPLHPHRLAKLANALGISAPVPLSQSTGDPTPSSTKPSSEPRRSPTPSVASATQSTSHSLPSTFRSKFLLHVVPPSHIPHDSDSSDGFDLTPPPPTASGYHTQFKRGTLVPLLPTLQSQLSAIAKEYALPSTAGMILYLVSSAPNPSPETDWTEPDGPGPRLSDDIWKHLWTRVANFEIETFAQEFLPSSGTLRPLISPGRVTPQSFTSPLTPTSSSASSNPVTYSAPSEISLSETNSPDTSLPPDSRAATLDLPGLASSSVIPILAKVEFDIDKRKAAWYGPWIRSRKLNHQKRDQRSRTRSGSSTAPTAEGDSGPGGEAEVPKAAPLPLRLVDRQAIPRFLLSADEEQGDTQEAEYIFSESPLSHEDVEPEDMANSPAASDGDPLADVFETDGDAWTDREANPSVVQLALDEQSLSEQTKVEDKLENVIDEEEVQALRDSQERPTLSLDIASPPLNSTGLSSPTTTTHFFLQGSTRLAYLGDGFSPLSEDDSTVEGTQEDSMDRNGKDKSPTEDKRIGTLFADLDLELELGNLGEALVRFSPRGLQHETKPQESPTKSLPRSSSSIDGWSSAPTLLVGGASKRRPREQSINGFPEKPTPVWPAVPYSSLSQEADVVETSFGLDDFPAPPKLALNGVSNDIPVSPYSKALSGMQDFESEESKARRRELDGHEPTYPQTVPPSLQKPISSGFPVIPLSPDPFGRFPSIPASPPSTSEGSESPEGLRPQARIKYSTFGIPPERHSSLGSFSGDGTVSSHTDPTLATPSSRFSIDSTDEGKNNRTAASLNPVKSIKSLWRKNRKASVSSGPGSSSPSWTGSDRASQALFSVPNLPGPSMPRSPTPTSLGASRESVASLALPADRYPPKVPPHDTPLSSKSPSPRLARDSSINSMVFDQESPYPVLVSSQRPSTSRPRTTPQPAGPLSPTLSTHRSSMRQSELPPLPAEADAMPPHATSPTDRERTGAPKSILKPWRSDNSTGPEQYATRNRRSRGASEVHGKPPGVGGNRVSASIESTRPPQTSPPRRPNRGTLRTIPPEDIEAFKIMDLSPYPDSGQII
ncbi:hypothetical protein EDB92DRAFT_1813859 [Lactarius akahatsu]|uniref:Proteophosphoglycan ppg4 n=1 Tax=Lactarius akahatsu TaxID=416441 RepID=A0AAD4QGH1_9AGAM|nr:hypothetical protein EDB92DRAFT_1813859 [Lactarius akahatsu]